MLGVNCRHILLYNLAVQQLRASHPMAAFDSLLEVVQVYHTNPRLWLRLAEACIAAHSKVGGAWVAKSLVYMQGSESLDSTQSTVVKTN